MNSNGTIRFLQINLNRCRAAHDLLWKTVDDENIDVVIGQEPNKTLFCDKSSICDKNCDSFLIVNKKFSVINSYRGNGFIIFEIEDLMICSAYFSPNQPIEGLNVLLNDIDNIIKGKGANNNFIFGGDLNAKTPTIGSSTLNERGKMLDEFLFSNNLIALNEGSMPTFVGALGTSVIDFSAASSSIAHLINDWFVDNSENLSDHQTIKFTLQKVQTKNAIQSNDGKGWILTPNGLSRFSKGCEGILKKVSKPTANNIQMAIANGCNRYLKRNTTNPKRKSQYWWNDSIAEQRRKCVKTRRILQRLRAKAGADVQQVQEMREIYKTEKRELKRKIWESKINKWNRLCEELDNDVWGKAYQIACRKLGTTPRNILSQTEMNKEIQRLFPQNSSTTNNMKIARHPGEVPKFQPSELQSAIGKLKLKKATGPDYIPAEVIKICVTKAEEVFLQMYNDYLCTQVFPVEWKISRLVLLEKPKKNQTDEVSYRPICIVNCVGKLFEILIKNRMETVMEERNILNQNQFGFRKGLSTLNAVQKVKTWTDQIRAKAYKNRECSVLIMLDIKNAFNTAPWDGIIEALKHKNFPLYIINTIKSYLSERKIVTNYGSVHNTSCGVPQGSVLGPILWNIYYDQILNLKQEAGVEVIAYADDLTIAVKAKTVQQLEEKAQWAATQVIEKLSEMGLAVATAKTEVLFLTGQRAIRQLDITIMDQSVQTSGAVKYLGIYLDRDLRMTAHVNYVCQKSVTILNNLRRIMPRLGGPSKCKRQVLASVLISTILYGTPIWSKALNYKKYELKLNSILRLVSIAVTSGYRTVPTQAIMVIAGIPPVKLLAEERTCIYEKGKEHKQQARKSLLQKWEEQWNSYDGWAKWFIPSITTWIEQSQSQSCINYYVTQCLTGHGCFGSYLKRIGKQDTDTCGYCASIDTPEHTIFECDKFSDLRETCKRIVGTLDKRNVGSLMSRNEENFQAIMNMMSKIMERKCLLEREANHNEESR